MRELKNEELKQMIKAKGFKLTKQRISVVLVLEQCEGEHLTAEEIYDRVKQESPEIGLATVYRTIQLLLDLKIIDRLNLDDGCVRYELDNLDNTHHHHHLVCEQCGTIYEVKDDLLDTIEQQVQRDYKFEITNHILKFYGVCEQCNQK
jgi:Fur family ferric uptake transcriptional regulator